jgi:hypothetical protein
MHLKLRAVLMQRGHTRKKLGRRFCPEVAVFGHRFHGLDVDFLSQVCSHKTRKKNTLLCGYD